MKIRLLAAVAAALCASVAQADVVYNWQQILRSPSIDSSQGRIVFTDAAYLSGSVNYRHELGSSGEASPVRSFTFSSTQGSTSFGGGFGPSRDFLLNAANLTLGNLMTGTFLSALHIASDTSVSLAGQGSTWTVQETGQTGMSPPPPGCEFVDGGRNCQLRGAVGIWVLDPLTVPGRVPLPGTLPLIALASFGIAATLRKQGIDRARHADISD